MSIIDLFTELIDNICYERWNDKIFENAANIELNRGQREGNLRGGNWKSKEGKFYCCDLNTEGGGGVDSLDSLVRERETLHLLLC
ncbi:hypothetical protein U1Q18_028316 [Sarracenia purpurea var. burkii]